MPTIPTPADLIALAAVAEAAQEAAYQEWESAGVAFEDAIRTSNHAHDALADAEYALDAAEKAHAAKREAWHVARLDADSAQDAADAADMEAEDAAVRAADAQDEASRMARQTEMEEIDYIFQEPYGWEHRYP